MAQTFFLANTEASNCLEAIAERLLERTVVHRLFQHTTNGGEDGQSHETEDWRPDLPCTLCSTSNHHKPYENLNTFTIGMDDVERGTKTDHSAISNRSPDVRFENGATDGPLDLSRGGRRSDGTLLHNEDCSETGAVELRIPRVFQKLGAAKALVSSSKRSYTEQALSDAATEICTNKIGTRRAAALYGIPRSTLRNKILRMRLDDSGDVSTGHQSHAVPPDDIFRAGKIKLECSLGEWDKRSEESFSFGSGFPRGHILVPSIGMMPPFFARSYMLDYGTDFDRSFGIDRKMPSGDQPFPEYSGNCSKKVKKESRDPISSDIFWETFPGRNEINEPLVTEEENHLELKIPRYTPTRVGNSTLINSIHDLSSQSADWMRDSLLAPSVSSTTINSVLKDVIEQTITEKFRSRYRSKSTSSTRKAPVNISHSNDRYETPSSDGSLSSEPPSKHARLHVVESILKTSASSSPDVDEAGGSSGSCSESEKSPFKRTNDATKKTRPKRGQYRRYNRTLLLEAVKAVQQGDMSVHRAGSYYGVPHSTLEYKVKERHLLRQRKSAEASGKATMEKSASCTEVGVGVPCRENSHRESFALPLYQSGDSTENDIATVTSSVSQHFPFVENLFSASLASAAAAAAANLSHHPLGYFSSALPLGFRWPPLLANPYSVSAGISSLDSSMGCGFGFGTSASDLLKRLQQKVQANSTRERESLLNFGVMNSFGDEGRLLQSSPEIPNGHNAACSVDSSRMALT